MSYTDLNTVHFRLHYNYYTIVYDRPIKTFWPDENGNVRLNYDFPYGADEITAIDMYVEKDINEKIPIMSPYSAKAILKLLQFPRNNSDNILVITYDRYRDDMSPYQRDMYQNLMYLTFVHRAYKYVESVFKNNIWIKCSDSDQQAIRDELQYCIDTGHSPAKYGPIGNIYEVLGKELPAIGPDVKKIY